MVVVLVSRLITIIYYRMNLTTVDNPTQTYPTPELPKQTDIPSTMFGRDVKD